MSSKRYKKLPEKTRDLQSSSVDKSLSKVSGDNSLVFSGNFLYLFDFIILLPQYP